MLDTMRIFIGADRSQALAVRVLEHSIKRHATVNVDVIPMLDLPIREPKDLKNAQRTGFSFSRFCIPKLAGYRGKALYLDPDMLVFKDIRSLWEIPFDGAKVVIQKEVKHEIETTRKDGAPQKRQKQCSVMLLDCERLDWDVDAIIDGLDRGDYDYETLMNDLIILKDEEIKYGIPFEWNSLEFYDENTCLIHYTDMLTQPWTSCRNKNAHLWFDEVRCMLESGALKLDEIRQEIELGYLRPSLLRDIVYGRYTPGFLKPFYVRWNIAYDASKKYVPHKDVYAAKRRRLQTVNGPRDPKTIS
jgi:lipopolysaccharide biosynthesis glycosyltransferase